MSSPQDKPFFKIGEVCERTGTQPYVLRFWESEFPALAPRKNRSGQRMYRQRDIELIERIKALLYDQEYTIAGARKVLESELGTKGHAGEVPQGSEPEPASGRAATGAAEEAGYGSAQKALDLGAADGNGRHTAGSHADAERHGDASADHARSVESQLEVEVKNLRAKLAHVEGEIRSLLDEMDRRDRR